MANRFGSFLKAVGQLHVRPQLGQNADLPLLPDLPLRFQIDIGHIRQDDVWQPGQSVLANPQAGTQKQRVPTMAGRNPRYHGNQEHPFGVGVKP